MKFYHPTDLIMISPEVYGETLTEFGLSYQLLWFILSIGQAVIFLYLLVTKEKSTGWVRAIMGTVFIEWVLLTVIFYPFFLSEIAWYWPWTLGLSGVQALLVLGFCLKGPLRSPIQPRHLITGLVFYITIQGTLMAIFSSFTYVNVLIGPLQAILLTFFLLVFLKPSKALIPLVMINGLLSFHEVLLMMGR